MAADRAAGVSSSVGGNGNEREAGGAEYVPLAVNNGMTGGMGGGGEEDELGEQSEDEDEDQVEDGNHKEIKAGQEVRVGMSSHAGRPVSATAR